MTPAASFKLTLISPYPTLTALTTRLASEYECEVTTVEAVLDEARNIAIDSLPTRPDVLLSRGGTAEHLRAAIQDIPVLSINTSALDLLCTLQPFAGDIRSVSLANFGRNLDGVADIARALNIQIDEYVYHSREELAGQILLAHQKGTELAVGGQLVVREAQNLGMHCVLLQAGEHAVREALREARSVAQMHRWLNRRNAWLHTILNNIAEGVIVTDENDSIRAINPMAERLLSTTSETALGQWVTAVIPNSRVPAIRESGQAEFGELLHVTGKTLVASRVPIIAGSSVMGVVCTFADGSRIQRAEQRLRGQMRQKGFIARYSFDDILTTNDNMRALKNLAAMYAKGSSTVLLQGETGTGKELFAQALHRGSPFADGPFVAVNCAAIPETLLESELFGYEEGAFTGARRQGKAGLFEMAHRGTLFLDEIGEIPGSLQARLLRALQEREVMRIGGSQVIPIEVRIICATNRDLAQRVREGHFRQDLFYRLNVLTLRIPPLRERREDIPFIGLRLLREQLKNKHVDATLEAALTPLMSRYTWPGNLRELQNTMERLALVANLRPDQSWADIIEQIWAPFDTEEEDTPTGDLKLHVASGDTLKNMTREAETQIIRHFLSLNANDQTRTATELGISRMSLWRRLQDTEQ